MLSLYLYKLFALQETDYNMAYFDNGEEDGKDDDDDLDEGGIY